MGEGCSALEGVLGSGSAVALYPESTDREPPCASAGREKARRWDMMPGRDGDVDDGGPVDVFDATSCVGASRVGGDILRWAHRRTAGSKQVSERHRRCCGGLPSLQEAELTWNSYMYNKLLCFLHTMALRAQLTYNSLAVPSATMHIHSNDNRQE